MQKSVGIVLAVGLSLFVLAGVASDLFQPTILPLKQRVMDDMQGIQHLPQASCSLITPRDGEQEYNAARERALARLLSAPEAKDLSLREIEAIFAEGIQAALGIEDGAQFLDVQNGDVLVSMKLPFCRASHRFHFFPPLYVFNRQGDFWLLGNGELVNVQWMEDRWVGFSNNVVDGYPRYYFASVAQADGEWQLRRFEVAQGPALDFDTLPTIEFLDSYRKLFISAENKDKFATVYNPTPCEFGDAFSTFTSRDSCRECEVRFSHAQYWGDFTLEYEDGRYILSDETPYEVRVVLSDSTYLDQEAPSEQELADRAPHLREGSWRDYCVVES
jgi:hypothetical protein